MKLFKLIFSLRFRQVFEWIFPQEEEAMRASRLMSEEKYAGKMAED